MKKTMMAGQIPRRGFANMQMKLPVGSLGNWALIGAGVSGLAYLVYYGRALSYHRYEIPTMAAQQMHFFHPVVQHRIR